MVEPENLVGVQHVVLGDEGIVILAYRARLTGGELEARDEVQEIGWFTPDALPPLAFTSHRRILQGWSKQVLARGAA